MCPEFLYRSTNYIKSSDYWYHQVNTIEQKYPVNRVDNTEMAEQIKMPFGGYTHYLY